MSRFPASTGTTGVCPAQVGSNSPYFTQVNCDQIMGFALWSSSTNNYPIFAWPWNEPIIGYEGTAAVGPPINFAFSTKIDPCPGWTLGTNCSSPGFPIGYQGYGGGKLAIAANGSSNATLWGTKYSSATSTGQLWGWAINTTPSVSLTSIFSPTISQTNAGNCTGLPTLPSSWIPAKFAEPTLVNGKIYVPAFEAFSSGTTVLTGGGVLVFGVCP